MSYSWPHHTHFVITALAVLTVFAARQCRDILKWTYVFAFFMFDKDEQTPAILKPFKYAITTAARRLILNRDGLC